MKKEYLVPQARNYPLRLHTHLLAGSVENVDGTDVGVNDEVTDQTEEFARGNNMLWEDDRW